MGIVWGKMMNAMYKHVSRMSTVISEHAVVIYQAAFTVSRVLVHWTNLLVGVSGL